MIIYKEPFPKLDDVSAVALGTFDGVHLGHKAVIREAVRLAKESGGRAAVWCFSEPPRKFFIHDGLDTISTPEEKAALIESLGVDILIIPDLSKQLLCVPAEEFLTSLHHSLFPNHIVCGFNYSFGAGAAGTTDMLRDYFESHNTKVTVIPPVTTQSGIPVSSTLIRKKLERGESVDELIGK